MKKFGIALASLITITGCATVAADTDYATAAMALMK